MSDYMYSLCKTRLEVLEEINEQLLEALEELYQMAQYYRPRPKDLSPAEHVTPIEQETQEEFEVGCLYYKVEAAIATAEGE